MAEHILCKTCGKDCTNFHVMCDRVDGAWCSKCFDDTPCAQGEHGEGCATSVFGRRAQPQEAKP